METLVIFLLLYYMVVLADMNTCVTFCLATIFYVACLICWLNV